MDVSFCASSANYEFEDQIDRLNKTIQDMVLQQQNFDKQNNIFSSFSQSNFSVSKINGKQNSLLDQFSYQSIQELPFFPLEDEVLHQMNKAMMKSEDFRSNQLRSQEQPSFLYMDIIDDSYLTDIQEVDYTKALPIKVDCSLGDLYALDLEIQRFIEMTENSLQFSDQLKIGNLVLDISVTKQHYNMVKKSLVVQNQVQKQIEIPERFLTYIQGLEDQIERYNIQKQPDYYFFGKEIQKSIVQSFNDIKEIGKCPQEQFQSIFGLENSTGFNHEMKQIRKQRQEHLKAKQELQWQYVELNILKQNYIKNIQDLNILKGKYQGENERLKEKSAKIKMKRKILDKDFQKINSEKETIQQQKGLLSRNIRILTGKLTQLLTQLKASKFTMNQSIRKKNENLSSKSFQTPSFTSQDTSIRQLQDQFNQLQSSIQGQPTFKQKRALDRLQKQIQNSNRSQQLLNLSKRTNSKEIPLLDLKERFSSDTQEPTSDRLSNKTSKSNQVEDELTLLKQINLIRAQLADRREDLDKREKELHLLWSKSQQAEGFIQVIEEQREKLVAYNDWYEKERENIDREKIQAARRAQNLEKLDKDVRAHENQINWSAKRFQIWKSRLCDCISVTLEKIKTQYK